MTRTAAARQSTAAEVPPLEALAPGPPAREPRAPATLAPEPVSSQAVSPQAVSPQAVSPQAVSPQTVSPQAVSPQAVSPQTVSPQTVSPQHESREPGSLAAGTLAARGTYADDPDVSRRSVVARKLFILAIILYFLAVPAVVDAWRQNTPARLFMLLGIAAFVVIVSWVAIAPGRPGTERTPWAWLAVIVGLGIALFVVGGEAWMTVLAVAAAACGRFSRTVRPATFGAATCTIAGLALAVVHHYNEGNLATVLAMPPMAAFFAYTAGQRVETVAKLRQTRAELARVAVAEERLRIARDLHDLLGHSLSLITLKAELSRRVLSTDAERAAREIAELEYVARQSLSDVREAVAGYRQPDLAAELAAARQLLTAAGVTCLIEAPPALDLPGSVDAALAWTIREGVTNVVRHARASNVVITVTSQHGTATAEITDDGDGTDCQAAARTGADRASAGLASNGRAGSGLAGLAERVRGLGGDLVAGRREPHGFRLLVTIRFGQA